MTSSESSLEGKLYVEFIALIYPDTALLRVMRSKKCARVNWRKFRFAVNKSVVVAYEFCNLHGLWIVERVRMTDGFE